MTSIAMEFRSWRIFLAGIVCGTVLTTIAGAAWLLWMPHRSVEDEAAYDNCLLAKDGSTSACDAFIRILQRQREADERAAQEAKRQREKDEKAFQAQMKEIATNETKMKQVAAEALAAGFSKREVVDWLAERGWSGKQLSDAVGISLQELQEGKY